MDKPYGIRITLPGNDTLSMKHLLGTEWESFRWFKTSEMRDRIYKQMQSQPENYREGDNISVTLEKIESE